jgi:uncharacterized membrane protein
VRLRYQLRHGLFGEGLTWVDALAVSAAGVVGILVVSVLLEGAFETVALATVVAGSFAFLAYLAARRRRKSC